MELILRNRRTGELLRLNRTKILARHGRKVVLLAPYPGQWVCHVLVEESGSRIFYNCVPAPVRCSLAVGDLLELEGLELIVESVQVDSHVQSAGSKKPSQCEIELPGEGRFSVSHDVMIGYDPTCGLSLVAKHDLRPVAALLAYVAGNWRLHVLQSTALLRNGQRASHSLILTDGDRIRIHDREIVFHLGETDSQIAGQARTVQPHAAETKQLHDPSLPPPETVKIVESSSSSREDEVYKRAKDLCQRLLPVLQDSSRLFVSRKPTTSGVRGWLRLFRRPGNPLETLDRLEFLLARSPRDRVWLEELARFLYQQAYLGLCLRVLTELSRLYPRDGELQLKLARFYYQQGHFYYQQGQKSHQLTCERLTALKHAERCLRHALELSADEPTFWDLQHSIERAKVHLRKRAAKQLSCEVNRKSNVNAVELVA